MKHLFYLPAFLALATVSVHAQDTGAGQAGSDTDLQTQSQQTQPGGDFGSQSQGGISGSTGSQGAVDFASADIDGNGELSVEEAQEALPDLIIVDINNDGVLNRSEAENALPGLSFDSEGDASSDQPVGEEEFDQIVSAMEERASGSQVGSTSDSDLGERSLSSTSDEEV